ncbi:MAG: hypothetical protein D8M58_20050 [Calditrichaeota bacterium]|nr:MAG: hypothetical protein DWQ03_14795 [Calditrichota bacterium]MBL1207703.1 hypothetical protein [Calditrichota bacterium]NOG47538.1 hypothetical protein [Calditrichota bacterium]
MFNPEGFYPGFKISNPVGNNAFSFEKRKKKEIHVPPLIKGTHADLQIGDQIAFSEIVDGKELNYPGLKNFIHFLHNQTEIFIFDNHNHAIFFWAYALQKGLIDFGENLVHVDQHTDMRGPDKWISKNDFLDVQKIFDYTNYELNVGNFIQPAIKIGLFDSVEIIDSSVSFEKSFEDEIVLDLDMDVFSSDMNYIPEQLKIEKIKEYIEQAKFITIATSPFFIDQQKAINLIQIIL